MSACISLALFGKERTAQPTHSIRAVYAQYTRSIDLPTNCDRCDFAVLVFAKQAFTTEWPIGYFE